MPDVETPPAEERPGDPCTIVIFGSAGDLTKRKLLPALYNLRCHGLLPRDFALVGVARREMNHETFREQLTRDIRQFATTQVNEEAWEEFCRRLYFCPGELSDRATYQRLVTVLKEIEKTYRIGGNVLFYLSTPPTFFAEIVQQLGAADLTQEGKSGWRRVIIEKPFGRDLKSAIELNEKIRGVLREKQIYRIDHYLGKETVQNILAFRFANGVFEPIWNHVYVDHVQISVAENIGVENRGGYYESAGALRDMIQNHMLQLLTLVAMEPPASLEASQLRDEKVKVLSAIRPMTSEEILYNGEGQPSVSSAQQRRAAHGRSRSQCRGSSGHPLCHLCRTGRRQAGDRSGIRQPIRHSGHAHLYCQGRGWGDVGQRRSDPVARRA